MSDQSKDTSSSHTNTPAKDTADEQAKVEITTSGEPETQIKTSYYLMMLYAALFGAGAAVLAAAYITLYNQGIKFFEQPSGLFKINGISFWPLILLTVAGVLLGLAIKFFGQHAGLGVAQGQYTKTGSFIADRLKLEKDDVPLLVYSAIAGAFGGFFGSPIVGALGAYEYMFIKELDFYRHVIPGLVAAAAGYSVYFALLQTSFLGIFSFPTYASP